jgi:hypothetical protein
VNNTLDHLPRLTLVRIVRSDLVVFSNRLGAPVLRSLALLDGFGEALLLLTNLAFLGLGFLPCFLLSLPLYCSGLLRASLGLLLGSIVFFLLLFCDGVPL